MEGDIMSDKKLPENDVKIYTPRTSAEKSDKQQFSDECGDEVRVYVGKGSLTS